MAIKSVSNTGPIIHLNEINLLEAFNIFDEISIPEEVSNELKRMKITLPKKIKIHNLKPESKDKVFILTNQYDLDLGESEAITLCMQEKSDYFLTDDLDARNVAKSFNLNVHGTIGIILRAFRERIIDKGLAIKKVKDLYQNSSLFITSDLIDYIIKEINDYK